MFVRYNYMVSMKRILVYGLSNGWGGVEAIVMSMIDRMAGKYVFEIIHSLDSSSYAAQYESEFIRFVHMPSWGADRKGFASALKKYVEEKRFDYVWVNGCIMANKTIISVVRRFSDAKIIMHSHGSSFESSGWLKRLILLALHILNRPYYICNIDYPCMCSLKSGRWFYGKRYLNRHAVHHIKNGVDTAKFKFNIQVREAYRKEFGVTDEFLVFHAGRLTEVKNQRKILSVVADALAVGMNVKLIIAGDGECREDLNKYAQELGLGNRVLFLGLRNDVANFYQAADVMLLPSFHEGFPVTLTEAQTSGLPCLVSDRVSDETNITGLVRFLSIDEDCNSSWVSALKDAAALDIDRYKFFDEVCAAGYSIDNVCAEFIEFIDRYRM